MNEGVAAESVLEAFGRRVSGKVERWMPDPFLFAVILTFIALLMGCWIAGNSPASMVDHWYRGFWDLLAFGMQMVLILVTGYVLAYHPLVNRGLRWLASRPNSTRQAVVMIAICGMILGWVNWGLGLVVGAILARETGRQAHRRGVPMHYPLVVTSGYISLGMIWHWGLSASAPLLSATEQHIFSELIGMVPTSQTIFHPYTLKLSAASVVVATVLLALLSPRAVERCKGIDVCAPGLLSEREEVKAAPAPKGRSAADVIENSRIIGAILTLLGLWVMARYYIVKGGGLNLNIVNYSFLFIGLLLYMNPIAYARAFTSAVPSAAGIVLQFPFYAGIMGMIKYSGLGKIMAGWLVGISSGATFPVVAWLTGGLVNIFVPSGGGEWAVIGETMIRAAQELQVPIGKVIVAYGAGDQWTNLLQPFWAIPLLGICGVRARDIFGYCIVMMLLSGIFFALGLTFIPY